ncbi:PfkB family carbohydrate kinase [Paenibacillus sp. LHD-117]|uniref:PfkB family carbohydrate kinase n=1 Tax=Paenibacillus sp. LHD-117 TaxID=3071412 RepID=UPI0027E0BE37|nr:PfkB family carbohydrate kinase [Paenibacillus sp. LHD-117]MDQ6423138.1 PfkB family carbohydrate kinase [Paenibacillus sp. LHD-117]
MNNNLVRRSGTDEERRILVIGAAVVDVIIALDKLPKTAEDVMAEHKETVVGGCAYNVSNILQQFRVQYGLLAPVGKGTYADIVKGQLMHDGVPILLEDATADNGWNLSIVESDGERTFITIPGIESRWERRWFEHLDLDRYDYLYISGYELEGPSGPVILDALSRRKPSAKLVFDPGPRGQFLEPAVLDRVLGLGTIVHANQSEILALMGGTYASQAAEELMRRTGEPVVVTLGGEGTLYCSPAEQGFVKTERVKVVDTIGAGDAHTGAFLAGLARGYSLQQACELGNVIAGQVVQQQGGRLQL